MRRLEFKDAKSHKFWELSVEGDAYTVRYGKVGTDGQTQTKTCASPDKAKAEGEKKLASKVKKGYVEVALDPAIEAKRAAAEASRNPALEQAIFDAPEDRAAWQVYGDWLQQQDNPRGELILLGLEAETATGAAKAKLEARIAELETEHRAELLGGLAKHLGHEGLADVSQFEWSRGYIVSASVNSVEEDYEGPAFDSLLRALVKSPAGLFLRQLDVGTSFNDDDWMGAMDKNLQAITKAGKLEALTTLTVEDAEGYWDISSTVVGDLTAAIRVAPRLRKLRAVGGGIELEAVTHERLEQLTLKTGGLPGSTARAVSASTLPNLTSLMLYFGSDNYGASASITDLKGLFAGKGLAKLQHLGLVNAEFQDEIVKGLAGSKILAQLRRVDLSLGTMTDAGAQTIVSQAKKFAHLEALDLSENYISQAAQAELKAALPKLELSLGGQRTPDEWDGRQHYVSIGE